MYFINGCYAEENEAKISVLDLGVLRGFSVFDYLRTYNGIPFHLRDHLERLRYSAAHIGLTLPYTLSELEEIIKNLLHLTKAKHPTQIELSIKMIVTGGISSNQFMPEKQPSCILFTYPHQGYPPHFYAEGIQVITTPLQRSFPQSKTTQYTPAIVALQQSRFKNIQEALYLNENQEILEASTSNFFGIKNNTLYTCGSDKILFGITRDIVLQLSNNYLDICMHPIHIDDIPYLDEAFITASNKEIMPVISIDDYPIGTQKIGPHTQQLMRRFCAYTQQNSWAPLQIARYQL